ncbi:MAG: hypothetical protein ACRYGF_05800 [Janthinobacterium lividum]
MIEQTPMSILPCAPKQKICRLLAHRKCSNKVAAVRADADVLVIERACGSSTIVGFDESGTRVMVANAEAANQNALLRKEMRVGKILNVDAEFSIRVHIENALRCAATHRS